MRPEWVESFRRDGFVVVPDLIDAQELAEIGPHLDAAVAKRTRAYKPLAERSAYEQSFLQCINLWEDTPEARRLTFHPRVGAAAAGIEPESGSTIAGMTEKPRYTLISSDAHAGANHATYREYLDPKYHDDFDAWRAQYKGHKDVTVCFFGDGTTNIGAFHEALNFAAVWKLPVVFVCENNLYMEYTPIGDVIPVEHPAASRASAYGLEPVLVDGQDADAVYRAALAAYDKARAGGGPSLIECKMKRYYGHFEGDTQSYRTKEEIETLRAELDCLKRFRERVEKAGLIDAAAMDSIDAEARAEIDAAVKSAKAASTPPASALMTDVYASY